MTHRTRNKYVELFISTFYLSAFTFGGGYVIIPLMREKFADELGWIKSEEMLDLAAIAQSSPGAVAVNAAILVGYRVAGFPGVLISIIGTILPPFIILTIISFFYTAFRTNPVVNAVLQAMQAGIAAVIFNVVFSMGYPFIQKKDGASILMMIAAFIATFYFKVHILWLIAAGIIIGVSRFYSQKNQEVS